MPGTWRAWAPAAWAARPIRRRNLGISRSMLYRRTPHRRCIQMSRCGPRSNPGPTPYRSTHRLDEVAACDLPVVADILARHGKFNGVPSDMAALDPQFADRNRELESLGSATSWINI